MRKFELLIVALAVSTMATGAFAQEAPVAAPAQAAPAPVRPGYAVQIKYYPAAQRTPAPIELANGIVFFKVKIAGRDAWMMLDNGADRTLINAALLEPLGLTSEAITGRAMRTPTGPVPYRVARDVPLDIPGQVQMKMPMAAVDLSGLMAAAGHPVDAILGGDVLGVLALGLDVEKRFLELFPSGVLPVLPVEPVPLEDGRPHLAAVAGGKPVKLTIDLGFVGELALSREAWARVGPPDAKTQSQTLAHVDGQPYAVDHAVLPQFGIGGAMPQEVGVDIQAIPARDGDGWIGMGYMRRFAMIMDVKAGRLWLAPHVPAVPAPPPPKSPEPPADDP